jgi:hypothetical protein
VFAYDECYLIAFVPADDQLPPLKSARHGHHDELTGCVDDSGWAADPQSGSAVSSAMEVAVMLFAEVGIGGRTCALGRNGRSRLWK